MGVSFLKKNPIGLRLPFLSLRETKFLMVYSDESASNTFSAFESSFARTEAVISNFFQFIKLFVVSIITSLCYIIFSRFIKRFINSRNFVYKFSVVICESEEQSQSRY